MTCAVGLALALVACSSSASPPPAADALGNVSWADHVRDCAVAHGGPGLGTVIDAVVKGDVNADGHPDTLVVDRCEAKTSSWPDVVEVFDGASDAATPKRLAVLLDGDADYMRDVRVAVEPGGRVVVTGSGLSDTAPQCCPDLAVRKVFAWSNGSLTLIERSVSPLTPR